ncbi:MAG: ATP-binding cassette domain-containing protein [Candidatus Omnitrophica bacterium]|jgi:ABC-type sugar transport system ATPase subunit|nr:ATP-binding cassette domain-containing protein [Candidatus Omnitrophota bacterium]
MSLTILKCKNIHKSFYSRNIEKKVLDGVDFEINQGEISSIFGYSGAGKTTLLSIIAGVIKQDKGNIIFQGENIDNLEPFERHISLVMDEPLLFPRMNVEKNIAFGMKLLRNKSENTYQNIEKHIKELMEMLDITGIEKRMPDEISMGQAQRVSIARALAIKPKILLMDEPFSNLDIVSKNRIRNLLKTIQLKINITILLVTHDIDDIINLSDTLFILKNGKIYQQGNPKNILKDLNMEQIDKLLKDQDKD